MDLPSLSIALTGGIATGKSATTERFTQLGVPVFDADVIARNLVAPGQPALAEIEQAFGSEMLTTGVLDRTRMRTLVFEDTNARRRLEAILHPRVRTVLLDQVRACTAGYCVLAIPLLVECRSDYLWVDRVLLTDAPRATQLRRLAERAGIDPALAERMLHAQATRAQRLALADDVIDNSGPIEALDAIVRRLHRRYLTRSTDRPES